MRIEPFGSYTSKWGEGPVYMSSTLFYVDIEGHAVIRADPDGDERIYPVGQRVGCALPCSDQRMLCAGDRGFFFLNLKTGQLAALSDPEAGLPGHRFNDGKCAPDGHVFAGSISLNKTTGTASLYRLSPDFSVTKVFSGVTNSNGLAWALDGRTLFYIDTPRKQVMAFDYAKGEISHSRVVIETSGIPGSPDGMTIDHEGMLWIAFCHGGAVVRFDPASGASLQRIDLPCMETTSVTFGSDDYATLFVTSGINSKLDEPLAGRVFAIHGLNVHGFAPHLFSANE